ncbi:DMT family transporter [Bacillus sp. B-jedd]|uniref:DMT family transporter n=1 Tax=Bacillus sp. B-jedd TaxID=1476857 RepID=UPI0005157084|nr:DMT family transporter [Bacillus sp. B-jedd]CEG28891.1 drug/metabolite transporter (DMT) superfamily protein [Bacillus sp. B-jedd]
MLEQLLFLQDGRVDQLNRTLGILSVLTAASLYGFVNTIVKLAYADGFTFAELTISQYVYGTLGLLVLIVATRSFGKISFRDYAKLLAVGGIGLGGTSLALYTSLAHVPTSVSLVMLFQFTWIGLLIEKFVFKRKIRRNEWLAVVIVLAGTLLVLQITSVDSGVINAPGVLYGFLAAIFYSVFLIGASVLPQTIPQFYKNGLMVSGTLVLLLIGFSVTTPMSGINPFGSVLKWGLMLGILAQLLPPVLFTYGAPKIGGTLTSILSSVELPVGIIASNLILGEKVVLVQWIGMLLILAGIVVSQMRQREG